MNPITGTVLRLDAHMDLCCGCDKEVLCYYGVPVFEGYVLPNSWEGKWGGMTTCEACWLCQQALIAPMFMSHFRQGGVA